MPAAGIPMTVSRRWLDRPGYLQLVLSAQAFEHPPSFCTETGPASRAVFVTQLSYRAAL